MSKTRKLDRDAVLLGTAAWYQNEGAAVRTYKPGDFFLGRLPDETVIGFNDDKHAIVCSTTRGGKGVSVIVPNLCLWQGSTVVIDPKGENAIVTARARGNGSSYSHGSKQKVRILDPFNAVQTPDDDFKDLKASFNPLDILDPSREESVDEAARIADALIVSEGSSDPYWEDAARDLLKGVILHVVSSSDFLPDERNLMTVRRLCMAGDTKARKLAERSGKKKIPGAFEFLFLAMRSNKAFGSVVADLGDMFLNLERKGERTFACISQVAATNTSFIDSPGMHKVLMKSDFTLSELKTDPRGTSLYICLPQRFMETHYRWLRMMVTLTITEMEKLKQQPASGHRVLMVIDEFPALKRMRVIENAAAQIAGFGVKMLFAVQTLAQLKDLYKDNWETLLANAGVKMFFGNDDHFTRQYVSGLIGDTEVVRTVRSVNASRGTSVGNSSSEGTGNSDGESMGGSGASRSTGRSGSKSTSKSEGSNHSESDGESQTIQKRALVTPDEVGRLFGDRDQGTGLLLISGYQPIFLKRTPYFAEKELRGFYDPHPNHAPPMTLAEAKEAKVREAAELEEAERERERAARLEEMGKELTANWRQFAARAEQARQREAAEAVMRQREAHKAALKALADKRRLRELTFKTIVAGLGVGAILAHLVGG